MIDRSDRTPTLHESRDDAEVKVFGDSSPITDGERFCARLIREQHRGALDLRRTLFGWRASITTTGMSELRDERAAAVAALTSALVAAVAQRVEDHHREAARLRALLADDGAARG